MYVRDHGRPTLHEAMGFDVTEYDMQVFRITTDISRQVFPVMLDIDNPRFLQGLQRLTSISQARDALAERKGLGAWLRRQGLTLQLGTEFLRLYLMAPLRNDVPENVRMAPTW
jgi:magnesium-protoporphyrin IX monomethyl ester (oxidative) cyclase